ncbi:MAG: hypothetical protein U0835_20715 [Isosphaeraceae bacterium]
MTVKYYVLLANVAARDRPLDRRGGHLDRRVEPAQGTWTPLNPNDSTVVATSNTATHVLNDRLLATQKGVAVVKDTGAAGPTPGDTLEYTVAFQVSDFFAFQNLVITDLISDGQHFDPTFTPTLQVNGDVLRSRRQPQAANFTVVGNYTGATPAPADPDGTSTLTFRVSDEMVSARAERAGSLAAWSRGPLPQPRPGAGRSPARSRSVP